MLRVLKMVVLSLGLCGGMTPAWANGDDDVELVDLMARMQYFMHKAALATDADNRRLARFYAHELEEVIEEVEDVDEYDDHPIGKLVDKHLEPAFEAFEDALKEGDDDAVAGTYDKLVQSCNQCHEATGHGFIRIERASGNPFMQSFSPQAE